MASDVIDCPMCGGNARKQFSVNAQLHIPLRFKAGHTISDYTPPKDHPSWANVAREGTTRAQKQETFRDHLRAEGLI